VACGGSEDEQQSDCGVDSGDLIIGHDTKSSGQFFKLADGPGFRDIEQSEQQESGDEDRPREVGCDPDQREGGDFVPDNTAGIFALSQASGVAAEPDPGQEECQPDESAECRWCLKMPEQPANGQAPQAAEGAGCFGNSAQPAAFGQPEHEGVDEFWGCRFGGHDWGRSN